MKNHSFKNFRPAKISDLKSSTLTVERKTINPSRCLSAKITGISNSKIKYIGNRSEN